MLTRFSQETGQVSLLWDPRFAPALMHDILSDFDLDTVKMLMSIFVRLYPLCLPSNPWSYTCLQDTDRSGTINFNGARIYLLSVCKFE